MRIHVLSFRSLRSPKLIRLQSRPDSESLLPRPASIALALLKELHDGLGELPRAIDRHFHAQVRQQANSSIHEGQNSHTNAVRLKTDNRAGIQTAWRAHSNPDNDVIMFSGKRAVSAALVSKDAERSLFSDQGLLMKRKKNGNCAPMCTGHLKSLWLSTLENAVVHV